MRFKYLRALITLWCVLSTRHTYSAGAAPRIKDDLNSEWARQIMRQAKSADISAMLDTRVDPCSDFYKFSCGNWHRSHPAQLLNTIMTDRFQQLDKSFNRRLEQLLNEQGVNGPEGDKHEALTRKMKNFYFACRLVKEDDMLYKMELESVYKEYGEMPAQVGDAWIGEDFNWWMIVGRIQHKYGLRIIMALDIMGDLKNNTQSSVYLGAPDYSLATHTKFLSALQEAATIRDLEHYLGLSAAVAKRTAKEMIALERALRTGGTDERLGLGLPELVHRHRVDELQEKYAPELDLKTYLEMVLGEVPDSIYVYDEQYVSNMLKVVSQQPKRVLANYILWQLLQDYLVDAEKDELPKWCIDKTRAYFGEYTDYFVYQRYKDNQTERDVYQVWEDVRETFREELAGDKLDWMSNATRKSAIEKLNAMQLQINSYEDRDLQRLYADVQLDNLKYVVNVQRIKRHDSRKHLAKLHQRSPSHESAEMLSNTPAYNILGNAIRIPVAFLQPHYFWDDNYPQAIKYATLGYLIAHEMLHGFDDEGRIYDGQGNSNNWWDPKSAYEFDARRKCFQAQYHQYKYGGQRLPESVGQAENIADNGGVKIAYATYQRWLREQREVEPDVEQSEIFPGLNFSHEQLFFVNFAQVWCEDVQSWFRSSVASSDNHAPGMYRVIGSLSNFQEFSWVFQCKPDAPMDPEFKCAIY